MATPNRNPNRIPAPCIPNHETQIKDMDPVNIINRILDAAPVIIVFSALMTTIYIVTNNDDEWP